MRKEKSDLIVGQDNIDLSNLPVLDPLVFEKGGTKSDGQDLYRMGKLPQLRVFLLKCISKYKTNSDFREASIFNRFLVILASLAVLGNLHLCKKSILLERSAG
jgi:hypothetical protein